MIGKQLQRLGTNGVSLSLGALISPEQCRGAGLVDAKTDCYALGVMLYELIAGRPPFESRWAGDLIGLHLYVEPPALELLVPSVEPRLAALVHGLLRKDKAQRLSMAETAEQLGELILLLEQAGGQLVPKPRPSEAFASTQPSPPAPPAQREPAIGAEAEGEIAGTPEGIAKAEVTPSQAELDLLFEQVHEAAVYAGGVHQGEPLSERPLLSLGLDGMQALREALLIRPNSVLRRCSCLGDLTIELRGPSGRLALLSYHHHEVSLLGRAGWDREVQLGSDDALVSILERRGAAETTRTLRSERKSRRGGGPLLRNWIQGPRPQPVVLPAALPPQFDEKKFVALLSAARSHAELRASAALLSRQELLSSHASALTRIPDEAWARLQEYVSDYGAKFMKPLVEHVQRMARAQHALSLSPPHSPEVAMLSRSEHGRLGNLVTDGVDLYVVAADKLLRISPIDGSIAVVTALPGSDIELASCGSSLVFTSRSAGTIGRVDAQRAQVEIWSSDRVAPRMPFHCGLRAHWIEQFETSEQYASLARIRQHGSWTEGEPDLLSLISVRSSAICGDSGSICILEPSADRRTQLRWLQSDGLHFEGVPPTAPVSAEAASPILALGATHAFWPAQEKVLWTLKLDTMYEVRATASGAVAAIVPDEQNLYVLVGNPQQRVWSVEYAAAGQNETRPLGYFERRESDRVSAIELGGRLFFACGELVYGAGLPRRLRTR